MPIFIAVFVTAFMIFTPCSRHSFHAMFMIFTPCSCHSFHAMFMIFMPCSCHSFHATLHALCSCHSFPCHAFISMAYPSFGFTVLHDWQSVTNNHWITIITTNMSCAIITIISTIQWFFQHVMCHVCLIVEFEKPSHPLSGPLVLASWLIASLCWQRARTLTTQWKDKSKSSKVLKTVSWLKVMRCIHNLIDSELSTVWLCCLAWLRISSRSVQILQGRLCGWASSWPASFRSRTYMLNHGQTWSLCDHVGLGLARMQESAILGKSLALILNVKKIFWSRNLAFECFPSAYSFAPWLVLLVDRFIGGAVALSQVSFLASDCPLPVLVHHGSCRCSADFDMMWRDCATTCGWRSADN